MLGWLGQNQLEAAERAVPEIESGLERYQGELRQERQGYFRYNIAILFFILEKHSEALRRFRLILEEPHSRQREDLRRAVFLLRLVLLLDSDQWDLLEYELRNTTRYFGQENQARVLSEPVLSYLRTRMRTENQQDATQLIRKLKEELSRLMGSPKHKQQAGLPELLCWAHARISQVTLREAVQELLVGPH